MAELHFTDTEVARFCNDVLSLNLTTDNVALVQQRTEGWVAGVRLLTLALGQTALAERTQRITSFARSQRFIFDYLAEEVLHQLAPDQRAFLLETSLLSELTPGLCQAITGREDAAAVLDDLYRRNLFLVELEAEDGSSGVADAMQDSGDTPPVARATYRYHALFAQFLQRQLLHKHPERTREIHRRAAEAHVSPARKVHHYLAAELWDAAVDVIEQVGQEQLQQGFVHLPAHWIEALPSAQHQRPWMRLLMAVLEVQRGQMSSALARLKGLQEIFAAQGAQLGEWYTLMALEQIGVAIGDPELTDRALEALLAQDVTPSLRASALVGRIWAAFYRSNWDQIRVDVRDVLDLALSANERSVYQTVALSFGVQLSFCDMPLSAFERYSHSVLQRFAGEEGVIAVGAYNTLAGVYLLRGQFGQALECVQQVQEETRMTHNRAADELAIRECIAGVEAGWNTGDGSRFAAPFAEDADYVIVDGRYINGRQTIAQGHQQIFDTIYRDTHNVATVQRIRFLSDDIAVVHVGWQLTFRQDAAVHTSTSTMVMAKSHGAWGITAFQNTPVVSR